MTSVDTVPGAQVYQGQLLCQIADLSSLELSAEVDEIYLSQIQVGDTLNFVLDAYPNEQLTGTVTEIRPLGTVKQNATYYDVRLSIPEVEGIELLPSMSSYGLSGRIRFFSPPSMGSMRGCFMPTLRPKRR